VAKTGAIKTGSKAVGHGRYAAFQMAGAAIPRNLFAGTVRLIAEIRLLAARLTI
jgi:hypothetical protein